MGHILWLASYPKSGNTWLRVFLANYFNNAKEPISINRLGAYTHAEMSPDLYEHVAGRPTASMTDRELHLLRPKVHRLLSELRPDTVIVKTHCAIAIQDNVPTVTPEVTAGAVYIVRNPLDMVISYADHFDLTLDEAILAINAFDNRILTNNTVGGYLSDWSGHVKSWTEAPGLTVHLVRYEDLIAAPAKHFGHLLKYMGLELNPNRMARAVKFSGMSELRRQERQDGFVEKGRQELFFREGRSGQWRDILTPEQVDAVVAAHRPMMQRHGYLP